jgi:two-component system, OmpR family, sensor kinase
VDNAIRHGPAGETVAVTIGRRGHDVVVAVEDDGPGVPLEVRGRLFDRFWRAQGAPPGGAGLGLAIAAWIVDAHGGTIQVSDARDGGARFEVRLPPEA